MLKPFFIALQFLTRLPIPIYFETGSAGNGRQLGRSVLYYPLVGLVVGGLLATLQHILSTYTLGSAYTVVHAAIILMVWVGLTGALHLDGLADSADAWLGGLGDRDRTLAIMKDPYSGPAGVTAIVLVLILKFAALSQLTGQDWQYLLIAPMLGRTAVVVLFLTTPYVRQGGIGSFQVHYLPKGAAWLVVIGALGLAAWLTGDRVIWVMLAVIIVWLWLRHRMISRIGGTTGDTAGSMVEIIETVGLVMLVI